MAFRWDPGRGSAAGSLVAYSLGITNIDPLEFDLLFERFLNPERISMPDIDIDFCFERRGEVIEYTRQKYGRDAVGQIITFGTMKSRAVIRDVGRTLGFEPGETDKIAKLIPNAPGQAFTVEEAVEKLPEVKTFYELDERHRQLFDYSMTLEGLSRPRLRPRGRRGDRTRAARRLRARLRPANEGGWIFRHRRCRRREERERRERVRRYGRRGQWPQRRRGRGRHPVRHELPRRRRHAEDGLPGPEDPHGHPRRRGGGAGPVGSPETSRRPATIYETIDDVPLDDPAVYAMLAHGGTSGIFQFESSLALDKLRAMRCDRFEDLVATNALIRPGPLDSGMTDVYIRRKLGQEPVRYPHPDLEKTLEPTYGIIVYQEQVMRIANVLAGYSLGEADVLRKAVGKKIAELIQKELGKFKEKAVARGVDARTAGELADQIETFGRYGFNKSHSAAYSLLSYHTAWLKAHYPAEFMAALLSSVLDKTDDVVKYIGECRELHRHLPAVEEPLEVLPPDVNESGWKFTVVSEKQIRFGLGAVRGVGAGAVQSPSSRPGRRRGRSPPSSTSSSASTCALLNKRAAEALIAAGALDAFGHRAQLLAGLDVAYSEVQARQAEEAAGQASLFGGGGLRPASARSRTCRRSPPGPKGIASPGRRNPWASTSPGTPWTDTGRWWRLSPPSRRRT